MSTYQIVINADDFGRHTLINQAVAKGVEEGILRSATLMPGGKAFDEAVDIAQSHPALGVGIHFTLVNGFPILPPEEIPSLVTKEGVFLNDYTLFVKHFLKGGVRMEEVRRELAAQAAKMERTGLPLTHVDSHQHMHVLPGIIDAVLDTAESLSIDAVRIPRTPLFEGASGSLGQLIGRLGLHVLAQMAAVKAKSRHFRMPRHFEGIVAGKAVSPAHLLHIACALRPGATEVMMHPGLANSVLIPACRWDHDFEAEMAAILSPEVQAALRKKGADIVNFHAL